MLAQDTASVSSLPSPSLALSSVDAISIGQSLDLRQAVRGEYLVKPQVGCVFTICWITTYTGTLKALYLIIA